MKEQPARKIGLEGFAQSSCGWRLTSDYSRAFNDSLTMNYATSSPAATTGGPGHSPVSFIDMQSMFVCLED